MSFLSLRLKISMKIFTAIISSRFNSWKLRTNYFHQFTSHVPLNIFFLQNTHKRHSMAERPANPTGQRNHNLYIGIISISSNGIDLFLNTRRFKFLRFDFQSICKCIFYIEVAMPLCHLWNQPQFLKYSQTREGQFFLLQCQSWGTGVILYMVLMYIYIYIYI